MSCEGCHTATAWKPIRPHPEFNHNTQTAYALRGMHAGVACQGCHMNPVFKRTAHDCAACHADPFSYAFLLLLAIHIGMAAWMGFL